MPTPTRIWLIAAMIAAGGLWLLSDVLTPFVLGMVAAYMLDPLCDRLVARGLSRTLATALITGAFVTLLAVVLLLGLPLLIAQTMELVAAAPGFAREARALVEPLWAGLSPHLTEPVVARVEELATAFAGTAAGWIGGAIRAALSGSLAVVDIVSTLVITPLITFYLIRDWDGLVAAVDRRIPRPIVEAVRARFREIDTTLAAWMRGVATVCLALGAYYAVALGAIGLSYGVLIGLIAGAVSFVPFVGFILGGALAVLSALFTFDHWSMWLATAAIFAAGQAAEGNILTPRLVGRAVNLHEVWVIFPLMAGGALFGFTGVLVAIPVTAVIAVLVRHADRCYLASGLYDPACGADPAPREAETKDAA